MNFTSESLARVLGISQTKTILHKHLSRKFMELIGPVASQNKVDAMQSKSFVCLDPTEPVNNFSRARSRSMGAKRGPKKTVSELLLPLDNQTNSCKSSHHTLPSRELSISHCGLCFKIISEVFPLAHSLPQRRESGTK